jgi:hypothetical protein
MATVVKDFRVKAGLIVEGSTATVNTHDILTEALVDAKGDLLVASAADAVTRLAVGTDNYVLTADSNATNGIAWKAPAAVGVFDTSISFEGTTADDYETTLTVTDPTADRTITLPNATGTVVLKDTTDTLTNKTIDLTSNTLQGTIAEFNTALEDADFATIAGTETLTNKTLTAPKVSGLEITDSSIVFEGSSADDNETTLTVTNPTEDRTITFPDATGTVALTSDIPSLSGYVTESGTQTLTNKTLTSPLVSGLSITDGSIVVEGATANDYETTLQFTDPTEDRTITFPDETGTVALAANVLALAGGTMTGAIAMGTNKITGLGTPTDATDAATKSYVDSAAQGIDWKASVRVASTENVDLSAISSMGTVIDGSMIGALGSGARILLKNQTNATQNGIYVLNSELDGLTRATDADTDAELTSNFAVFVEEGTVNADQGYVLTTDGAITVGTTALTFTQFTGLGQVVAGDGLSKTGNTLNVTAGTGISITGDAVTNDGVLSITGTANQISASASTGTITLSGPQDLHSAASPSFAAITLADALVGSALATASTSATVIDSWSASTYSSAKYIVQMKKEGDIEVIEVLVTVDGANNVYLTEYADVISNAVLGTTDADYNGGNVRLLVTGASADTAVKVHKVYIEA